LSTDDYEQGFGILLVLIACLCVVCVACVAGLLSLRSQCLLAHRAIVSLRDAQCFMLTEPLCRHPLSASSFAWEACQVDQQCCRRDHWFYTCHARWRL